jgi:hypothetical protein
MIAKVFYYIFLIICVACAALVAYSGYRIETSTNDGFSDLGFAVGIIILIPVAIAATAGAALSNHYMKG